MTDERTPTAEPEDEEDDTVQGVSKRAEKEIAEAQAIQDEQNAAAGLNPPDAPPTEPAPAPESKAPRKPPGA